MYLKRLMPRSRVRSESFHMVCFHTTNYIQPETLLTSTHPTSAQTFQGSEQVAILLAIETGQDTRPP